MQDIRQSQEYFKYMKSLGWEVFDGIFVRKLPLISFYFAKWQRPLKIRKQIINKLVGKYKRIYLRIEPLEQSEQVRQRLEDWGFSKDKVPMLPSKTMMIDLNKSKKQIVKEMHSKTRYNLKRYGNGIVKIKILEGNKITEKELNEFYQVYKNNYRKQKFWGLRYWQLNSLVKCFGRQAYLLKAKEGGLLMLTYKKSAYYSHNAVSNIGRKKFLPSLLVFEALNKAKRLQLSVFDFEGIEDKRVKMTKKWGGFSRFKKGFGGEERKFLGSFSKLFFKI
jgi:lipid II:glycine glycyltransferase (peptidoglycan interpeptide bridge formation enzyme)